MKFIQEGFKFIYIYILKGVNDHSEGCERKDEGEESRVWSGVNEPMTSRTSGYVQMEMAERVTSMLFVLHCIIQFYRIVQRDIRYLSSRGSIWLRCTGHDVTGSPTLPYFLPPLFFPEKGNFHGAAAEGQGYDTRDARLGRKYQCRGWVEGRGYYLSSLGEFDFLNFRRFIVASVALLSSSSS